MRLTRRDALAALAAAGVSGAAGGGAGGVLSGVVVAPRSHVDRSEPATGSEPERLDGAALRTLVATAEVLYPSATEGHREFVETYVIGRVAERPDYRAGLARAVSDLDATARDWHDAPFTELSRETRDRLLQELGVATAEPDPDGAISDRLRYFVVNDLLFAFYTSPAGGELVGIENPVGYPGGIESYRRPPPTPAEDETDSAGTRHREAVGDRQRPAEGGHDG